MFWIASIVVIRVVKVVVVLIKSEKIYHFKSKMTNYILIFLSKRKIVIPAASPNAMESNVVNTMLKFEMKTTAALR